MLFILFLCLLIKLLIFPAAIAQYGYPLHYVFGSMVTVSCIFLFAKLFKGKGQELFLLFVNLVASFLICATLMYVTIFRSPLSFKLLFLTDAVWDIRTSIINIMGLREKFILVMDILLVLIFVFRERIRSWFSKSYILPFFPLKKIVLSILLAFCFWNLLLWHAGISLPQMIVLEGPKSIRILNPLNYYAIELVRGSARYFFPVRPDHEKVAGLKTLLSEKSRLRKQKKEEFSLLLPEKASVLVLQVESLMDWPIGLEVKGVPVTPFLNSLASKAVFLPEFYSNAFQTCDADFAMLTSIQPPEFLLPHVDSYQNQYRSLPAILAQKGFSTFYANPCRQELYNSRGMNRFLGFENAVYLDQIRGDARFTTEWGVPDEEFFRIILPKLQTLPKPYFSMLLSISSHHPFSTREIPRKFDFSGSEFKEEIFQNYINAISYADKEIGNFFDKLYLENQNILFIIYGDHPSVRPWDTVAGIDNLDSDNHYLVKSAFNAKVPCFIYHPELEPGLVKKVASIVDLAPTILNALNIEIPSEFLGEPVNLTGSGAFLHKTYCGLTLDEVFWDKQTDSNKFANVALRHNLKQNHGPGLPELFEEKYFSELMVLHNLATLERIDEFLAQDRSK